MNSDTNPQIVRKSSPLEKPVIGNANKHDAYREAWVRIRLAQENGFFLEAITIQESIISDRLISFLSRQTATNSISKRSKGRRPSFNELIRKWESHYPNGVQSGRYENLIEAVNCWRSIRNDAIHAIVKFEPNDSTRTVEEFLNKAKEAAEEGSHLAKEVCNWCKRAKRREIVGKNRTESSGR